MFTNRVRDISWTGTVRVPIDDYRYRSKSNRILQYPKTPQEKCLFLTLGFLLGLVLVFMVSFLLISERWKNSLTQLKPRDMEEDHICNSEACKETAEGLLSNLDSNTDPCIDFFQYACGGWIKKHPLPEGKMEYLAVNMLTEDFMASLESLLSDEALNFSTPKSVTLVRRLYYLCLNKEDRKTTEITFMKSFLKELGGWPMLGHSEWSEENYVWYKHVAAVARKTLLNIILSVDIISDVFDNRIYKPLVAEGEYLFVDSITQEHWHVNENWTASIIEELVNIARYFGSTLDTATLEEDAENVLDFEFDLQQLGFYNSTGDPDENIFSGNMSAFDAKVEDTSFSYVPILNEFLKSEVLVNEDTEIYALQLEYLLRIPKLLSGVKSRVIANYISIYVVLYFSKYIVSDIFNMTSSKNYDTDIKDTETCTSIITDFMPEALGKLYVENFFPDIARYHIKKMLEMIRLAYSSTLDQNTWMDKETLLYALVKLQSIETMVGYQDWIMDDIALDKYYEKVLDKKDGDFLEYLVGLHSIKSDDYFSKWNKTSTRQEIGAVHPLVVNAFYHDKSNYVSLPAAFLGYPFYQYGRIDSINYGAIGTIIGHEMSHAFDSSGHQFDHLGNYRNWWTMETKRKFLSKAECFEKQYDEFVDPISSLSVNGKYTLAENIADNGAVRNAFKAFKLHLALSDEYVGNRKRLPELSASPEQLFFLGYASIWCANGTAEYTAWMKELDDHSPNKLRVNIPLANFKEFARAFKCDPGTPMNPKHKCILW